MQEARRSGGLAVTGHSCSPLACSSAPPLTVTWLTAGSPGRRGSCRLPWKEYVSALTVAPCNRNNAPLTPPDLGDSVRFVIGPRTLYRAASQHAKFRIPQESDIY